MKTKIKSIVINLCLVSIFIASRLFSTARTNYPFNNYKEGKSNDSLYVEIKGKIIDDETYETLIFANIYLVNTNIATVSNSDGEFIIKIPRKNKNSKIEFSYIGYKNKSLPISKLKESKNVIRLKKSSIPLAEVKIRPLEPKELVKEAFRRIPNNYSTEANMLTGFYRESVKKNWSYVAVSEGIIDIYKTSYTNNSRDLIKLYKARKSSDVSRMDTINFKLQGGPNTTMLLDIVKNPYILFYNGSFEYFTFNLASITKIDNNINYVIEFEQIPFGTQAVYKGKIYLDTESLAISAIEFNLNTNFAHNAASILVRKKPLFMKVTPLSANYYVNYRETKGKWYLNYARGEVVFKSKWKRKLFSSKYTTVSEIAITDRREDNVKKFDRKDILSSRDIFIDEVSYFTNNGFWGNYNYIKPDDSIESAIKKLNRKLDRKLDR
ncbi:MAG: carboxypeptidase-like regulatory domain-containing protein [Bacteroidales bacterium]|nr:carboxypeptidase-like regulatory domain-containing protein [Bacteroidales bacterium]